MQVKQNNGWDYARRWRDSERAEAQRGIMGAAAHSKARQGDDSHSIDRSTHGNLLFDPETRPSELARQKERESLQVSWWEENDEGL